jgi:hypothetical protein
VIFIGAFLSKVGCERGSPLSSCRPQNLDPASHRGPGSRIGRGSRVPGILPLELELELELERSGDYEDEFEFEGKHVPLLCPNRIE